MTEMPETTPASGVFTFPPTAAVQYGPGSLGRLGDLVRELGGERVFVVASARDPEMHERLEAVLGDRLVGRFTGTEMHVPRASVLAAAAAARAAAADLVVSVGGGTQIDCASGVCLALAADITTPEGFDAYRTRFTYPDDLVVPPAPPGVPPHLAVPTTLSGAESTNVFGITDPERKVKDTYVGAEYAPRGIVFDPELTVDVPDWLWAASGIRAVDHAVEGMLSKRHMPMADALGAEGLRILRADLARSCENPTDLAVRMQCQLGAWLSVYALTNVGAGLSHGLGHQLAAQFGMLHGVTSACMLPRVVEFNGDVTGAQLRRVGEAFDVADSRTPDEDVPAVTVAALDAFIRSFERFGVATTLEDAGARREELADVADHALTDLAVAANPKPVTREALTALLESAWTRPS
ncbi:MAG: iron-containing alcohol dehydrogenase [Patulibacter sp.]